MKTFVKERERPAPGSIPDLLKMFEREVRFYVEIASEVGVRVPRCVEAVENTTGFRLVLEDLSEWRLGGDPGHVAAELAGLHRRWEGIAEQRWQWLRRNDGAAEPIGELYDRVAAGLRGRDDIPKPIRDGAMGLVGRVAELERLENRPVRPTLIHGDASLRNVRTTHGEIAFLDWEDVRLGDGVVDLAWLLVSSVDRNEWEDVIEAYGASGDDLRTAMPAAFAQGVLTLADMDRGSASASAWVSRLESALKLF